MNTPTTTADRRKSDLQKKLKQIENDELKLKALEQELLRLQIRMASETNPIVEEFCDLRVENLSKLKLFLTDSFFKKKEKRQIIHLMVELADGLQAVGDPRAQAFLDELMPREGLEMDDEEDNEYYSKQFSHALPSEKQAEGKLEIKSLFRQLAKAFHPDKEPIEHLKEKKTDIMKKITAAYENQDLYGLLKLEKEHLGPRDFSEDKIELYIKYINDRLKELKTFEHKLKKHGPLATIYKFIYSRKAGIQEFNIRNEVSKIENEVQKEKELQPIIWDRSSLRHYLKY